jgi:PAS domain S-box-containing protein
MMTGKRTRDDLRRELERSRARVAELEQAAAERKRAEETLLLAQFTIDHAAMPTFWIGPDAQILRVNDAACRALGYSREQLLSKTVPDFDPDFPQEKWPVHWAELKQSGSMTFESHHRAKDGRVFPVEVFANYLAFKGQEYNVAFAREITDRKHAEQALRAADRLAAMGTVVAGVAHEINSPLTAIGGLAELLAKDRSLNAKGRDAAEAIVQQAIRCGRIVEDLLGFARAKRVALQPVQVNALVKRCLDLCRPTHRFDDVEIVEEYDADLPATMADPYRLEQVFINIIRNAGDILTSATSTKRLTVRSERLGKRIRVEFMDTGPGIADPGKVFDPFYTTKATGEGTGLGLSVSLGIVRDHGGNLTAENTKDGARFTVTLPVRLPIPKM